MSDRRSADAAGFCKAGIQKIGDRDTRKGLVFPKHNLSLSKQCAILGLNRTSIYYTLKGEIKENLEMMQKIDAEHMDHPAKDVVGMTYFLLEGGYKVGVRRVRRLMRLMGIMPVLHRKHLSNLRSASYIKSYLLRGLIWIERFWKTINYEYIYIILEENATALYCGIKRFIDNYNYHRKHQGSYRQVPSKLYIRPAA